MNKLGGAEKPQHKKPPLTIEAIHMFPFYRGLAGLCLTELLQGLLRDEDKVKEIKALILEERGARGRAGAVDITRMSFCVEVDTLM